MTKKKVPDPKQPTQAEKIRMIREAQELNVPFKEVLRRWHAEKGFFKPRPRAKEVIASAPDVMPQTDSEKYYNPIFDKPEHFPPEIMKEQRAGIYWVPAKDDGPNYEQESVPIFTRMRIFQYFKVYNIEQTMKAIYDKHAEALQDPEKFAQEYGSELTRLIIQL